MIRTPHPPHSRLTVPDPSRVALWAASQGWHVHPLTPGTKVPVRGCDRCSSGTKERPNPRYDEHDGHGCECIAAGRPCHGVLAATTDADRIAEWWNRMPAAGVGIAAGPSGLVILDIDCHGGQPPEDPSALLPGVHLPDDLAPGSIRDGRDVLALLCEARRARYPEGTPTLTVRTPSGGVHLWFRAPAGTTWRPLAGALGWQLDVRAGSSYAVAPGTATRTGLYWLQGDCRTVAELPVWLARDLERTGHRVRPERPRVVLPWRTRRSMGNGYVAAAVRDELRAVAEAPSGTRNDTLNRAAFSLGTLLTPAGLDRDQVAGALLDAARHAGLSDGEAQAAIRSGLSAGARQPRTLGAAA
ncbi:bifunctional DNA primase/polymerase [Streptomyces nondiastaticus]|uniref:Bifunctional DNA primase/polymerase n=1 Tax=Streptomyces nondiastaticus TaxID=3154512 RepID=A0ABW6U8R1_9ACTN